MRSSTANIGFWSALTALAFTLGYCIVQLLQVAGVLQFPTDEILIYGTSLGIVIPFLFTILALNQITSPGKKFWSEAALVFTVLYAVFVSANYVVQLATVLPLKVKGQSAGFLDQTPHSMFWNFDALGYIFMGITCFVSIPIFERSGFQKWVRLSLLANTLVTPLIAFVYFFPHFSENLLIIGYPWAITAPLFMLMLALNFRKIYNQKFNPDSGDFKRKQLLRIEKYV